MKRILNIHHILQMVSGFVILLSTSCEHKDLCYDHSHTTKIQVIFDWKNAPDATPETMRLYLFPVDGNKPQAYEFTDYRGGSVNVPAPLIRPVRQFRHGVRALPQHQLVRRF